MRGRSRTSCTAGTRQGHVSWLALRYRCLQLANAAALTAGSHPPAQIADAGGSGGAREFGGYALAMLTLFIATWNYIG